MEFQPSDAEITAAPRQVVGVFIDNSGSTGNIKSYHLRLLAILKQLEEEDVEVMCYYWNDAYRVATLDEIKRNSEGPMRAEGGTEISAVYDAMTKDDLTMDWLVLITDGQVASYSVKKVMEAMAGPEARQRWQRTEAHVITSCPDTSVIAPFIKDVPFSVYDKAGEVVAASKMPRTELMDRIQAISTAEQLATDYDELHARLAADTIASNISLEVREEILSLKNRIALEASRKQPEEPVNLMTEAGVLKVAEEFYRRKGERTVDPLQLVGALLKLCDTAGNFSIARLRASKEARLFDQVEEVDLEEVKKEPDASFIDTVLMDADMPLALFAASSEPIIPRDDVGLRETILRCPLLLLGQTQLVDRVLARIQPPHGLGMLREMRRHAQGGEVKSPETRSVLMDEVLVFGSQVGEASHVAANKALIAKLMFGGKKLGGSYSLWMVVLWHLLKRKSFVAEPMGPVMDTHIRSLLLHTPNRLRVVLGLSALGDRPTLKVAVGSALLYAVASTGAWTSPEHASRDMMRDLFGAFDAMADALELCGLGSDADGRSVRERFGPRVREIAALAKALWRTKKGGDKAADWLCSHFVGSIVIPTAREIRSSVDSGGRGGRVRGGGGRGRGRGGRRLGGEIVRRKSVVLTDRLDRPATEEERMQFTLIRGELKRRKLSRMPLPSLFPSSTLDPIEELRVGQNYPSSLNTLTEETAAGLQVKVSPKTLRPYLEVEGRRWEELAAETWGVQGQAECPSMHKAMVDFFLKHKRFPLSPADQGQILLTMAAKMKARGKPTLPASTLLLLRMTVEEMRGALEMRREVYGDNSMEVEAIRADLKRGISREGRREMEAEEWPTVEEVMDARVVDQWPPLAALALSSS